jgi:hypothetical protein
VTTSECIFPLLFIAGFIVFFLFGNGAMSMKKHDIPGLGLSLDVNSALRVTLGDGRALVVITSGEGGRIPIGLRVFSGSGFQHLSFQD